MLCAARCGSEAVYQNHWELLPRVVSGAVMEYSIATLPLRKAGGGMHYVIGAVDQFMVML
jgi:hypothetical protein